MSFFIIQDFPDTARFLSETERACVIRRLQADDQFSAAGEELRWKYIFASLLDVKTWISSKLCANRMSTLSEGLRSACIHGCRHATIRSKSDKCSRHQLR